MSATVTPVTAPVPHLLSTGFRRGRQIARGEKGGTAMSAVVRRLMLGLVLGLGLVGATVFSPPTTTSARQFVTPCRAQASHTRQHHPAFRIGPCKHHRR